MVYKNMNETFVLLIQYFYANLPWHGVIFSGKVPLAVLDEEMPCQKQQRQGQEEQETVVREPAKYHILKTNTIIRKPRDFRKIT